jgi:hypothetical protein
VTLGQPGFTLPPGASVYGLRTRDAVILGVIEGVTEYLPVSSTGHLIIASRVLRLDSQQPVLNALGEPVWHQLPEQGRPGELLTQKLATDTYIVIIQVGALLAVALLYWRQLWSMVLGACGRDPAGLRWRMALEDVPAAPADPELARRIEAVLARHLTPEDAAVVGRGARALSPSEAARVGVEAARRAAGADAAMIGATTFGAGLPAGDVPRHAFDACVRFDGPLFVAEVDGAWLLRLQARCRPNPNRGRRPSRTSCSGQRPRGPMGASWSFTSATVATPQRVAGSPRAGQAWPTAGHSSSRPSSM